jgi:pSer/pThr/pTyr-binding forkhead associated (FHA) protein/tetratricopeptide (TPR) repeat protein
VPVIRFVVSGNVCFETDAERFRIGRSQACEFRIAGHEVSRKQGEVALERGTYILRNVGKNPMLVNGRQALIHELRHGDSLQLGDERYEVQIEMPVANKSALQPGIARLVLRSGAEERESWPLHNHRIIVGRAKDAHIHLEDPCVSRHHLAIEQRDDIWHVVLLSQSKGVKVNGQPVDNVRLYSGDEISVENTVLVFESSRQEHQRPLTEEVTHLGVAEALLHDEPTYLGADAGGNAEIAVVSGPEIGGRVKLSKMRTLVGRSQDADLILPNRSVSRTHLAVELRGNAYYAVRISRSRPILVCGQGVEEARLRNGDEIAIDPYKLVFSSLRLEDQYPPYSPHPRRAGELVPSVPSLHATTLVPTTHGKGHEAYLIAHVEDRIETHPLNTSRVVLGRAEQCDVFLDDASVSRLHCAIEKRPAGFFVVNLSSSNPVRVNDVETEETRLFDGDRLSMGSLSLTFRSDNPRDIPPANQRITAEGNRSSWLMWASAIGVALVLGSLVTVHFVLVPWRSGETLERIEHRLDQGAWQSAREMLEAFLNDDPPAKMAKRAEKLLVATSLGEARNALAQENLREAKRIITNYLERHGTSEQSGPLWALLDEVRFRLGQKLEDRDRLQEAMRQYLTVRAESDYYAKAQRAVNAIWLSLQNRTRDSAEADSEERKLTELLQRADENFQRKRYLTPINDNAYSLYRAVLDKDPDSRIALERIQAMKDYYRQTGERLFLDGECQRAIVYYQRYLFIEPESEGIRARLAQCRRTLASVVGAKSPKAATTTVASEAMDERRRHVRELLEESGRQSQWIMQYLFESKDPDGAPESPWPE